MTYHKTVFMSDYDCAVDSLGLKTDANNLKCFIICVYNSYRSNYFDDVDLSLDDVLPISTHFLASHFRNSVSCGELTQVNSRRVCFALRYKSAFLDIIRVPDNLYANLPFKFFGRICRKLTSKRSRQSVRCTLVG